MKVNKKIIITMILIIIIGTGIYFYVNKNLNTPMDPKNLDNYSFVVNPGDNSQKIVANLKEQGYINNPELVELYIKVSKKEFYANEYILNYSKTPIEIIDILASPQPNLAEGGVDKLVVIEGDNLQSIATKVSTLTGTKTEEILELWNSKSFINELSNSYWFITNDLLDNDIRYPLEGYFTPATYDITVNKTVEEITYQLLNNSEKVYAEYKGQTFSNGYDFHQILTLASIIERETNNDTDKYLVSGVFANRIATGMPLQADITVLYGLDNHKEQVTYADLEVDSPYNTYKHNGLPPGPIASPSKTAIDATINPKPSEYYYYFNTQDTGETIYSKTYDEHLKVSEENAWNFN